MLREVTHHDFSELYTICSDKELMKFVGDGNPLSEEQTKKWIDVTLANYKLKGFGMYAVIYKETGMFIGYGGLVSSEEVNSYELIYALSKAYRKLGLGTEIATLMVEFGFCSLHMKEIYASIDPENIPSKKILLKVGFREVFAKKDQYGLETVYFIMKR